MPVKTNKKLILCNEGVNIQWMVGGVPPFHLKRIDGVENIENACGFMKFSPLRFLYKWLAQRKFKETVRFRNVIGGW